MEQTWLNVGVASFAAVIFYLMWRTYTKTPAPKKVRKAPKLCDIDLAGIPVVLELLLDYGHDFAFVIIQDKESGRFLQFRKLLPADDQHYIELSLPIVDWSRPYIDDIISAARECDFEFLKKESDFERAELLYVFFEQDVAGASSFSQDVMQRLYGLPPTQTFEVSASGIPKGGQKITKRNQLPADTPDRARY